MYDTSYDKRDMDIADAESYVQTAVGCRRAPPNAKAETVRSDVASRTLGLPSVRFVLTTVRSSFLFRIFPLCASHVDVPYHMT